MKNKLIYFILFIILFGMASQTFYYLETQNTNPTLYELILEQTNDSHIILFNLSFIMILLYVGKKDKENNSHTNSCLSILKRYTILISIFLFLMLLANFIFLISKVGFNSILVNEWSRNSVYALTRMTPINCFMISFVLIGLRFIFCLYLSYCINTFLNSDYWGLWSIIIISFIDFRFYYQTNRLYPLNILPIEHTKIVYSELLDVAPVVRVSYLLSIIYWLVLIFSIYMILNLKFKKRDNSRC